ncbi:MAG: hypothetical protein S4CHLAM102_08070 [Chlamydiia bacterium]|nr:hypothetical protein [Chlamydiia bacterium]
MSGISGVAAGVGQVLGKVNLFEERLVRDLHVLVLSFLPKRHLALSCQVCRSWNDAARGGVVVQVDRFIRQIFPHIEYGEDEGKTWSETGVALKRRRDAFRSEAIRRGIWTDGGVLARQSLEGVGQLYWPVYDESYWIPSLLADWLERIGALENNRCFSALSYFIHRFFENGLPVDETLDLLLTFQPSKERNRLVNYLATPTREVHRHPISDFRMIIRAVKQGEIEQALKIYTEKVGSEITMYSTMYLARAFLARDEFERISEILPRCKKLGIGEEIGCGLIQKGEYDRAFEVEEIYHVALLTELLKRGEVERVQDKLTSVESYSASRTRLLEMLIVEAFKQRALGIVSSVLKKASFMRAQVSVGYAGMGFFKTAFKMAGEVSDLDQRKRWLVLIREVCPRMGVAERATMWEIVSGWSRSVRAHLQEVSEAQMVGRRCPQILQSIGCLFAVVKVESTWAIEEKVRLALAANDLVRAETFAGPPGELTIEKELLDAWIEAGQFEKVDARLDVIRNSIDLPGSREIDRLESVCVSCERHGHRAMTDIYLNRLRSEDRQARIWVQLALECAKRGEVASVRTWMELDHDYLQRHPDQADNSSDANGYYRDLVRALAEQREYHLAYWIVVKRPFIGAHSPDPKDMSGVAFAELIEVMAKNAGKPLKFYLG